MKCVARGRKCGLCVCPGQKGSLLLAAWVNRPIEGKYYPENAHWRAFVAERMQKFVSMEQSWPEKRPAAERVGDFGEIHGEFAAAKAAAQASRCAQCGAPFCQAHCPLQNNIPDWLKLTAERRRRVWTPAQL